MPRHIKTNTVAPEEPDAMESTSHVLLNALTVKHQILRLRFATLIATNLFAGQYAEVRYTSLSITCMSNSCFCS